MNPDFWNNKFSLHTDLLYGEKPNRFFQRQLDKMKPGNLLVPACGQGRDALYAAGKGHVVTAVDYSKTAVKHTLDHATNKGLTVKAIHADLRNLVLPENHFDAVALVFAHFPPESRKEIHHKIMNALKPGGRVILQGFTVEQLGKKSGGPKNKEMLFRQEMLQSDFAELENLNVETLEEHLEEGEGHRGLANLIQLTGVKK